MYYWTNNIITMKKDISDSCVLRKRFQCAETFHLLNQAKESLALVVKENMEVYEVLLEILQMHRNR